MRNTAKHIVDMIQDGTNVVVSHGNGPQVGMINNAFAYAAANDDKTPDMPFPEAGAMSQGGTSQAQAGSPLPGRGGL